MCVKHNTGDPCPICALIAKAGSWEHIWNQHADEPEQRQIIVRGSILSYETGQCQRLITYIHLNQENPNMQVEVACWKADLKAELSDVICQARLLCLFMGWNFEDVSDLGKTRIRKRTVNQMFESKPQRGL